jgi:hypothetical protein
LNRFIRRSLSLLVALLAVGPHGNASVSVIPETGDVNTIFAFHGTGWRPDRKVTASYFVVAARGGGARRTFSFRPQRKGGFTFRLTRPIGLVDSGVTSRMCFRQRRTRACADFYVAPPAAQFMPSTGSPGDSFLLVVSGFLPGRQLQATLTLPTGTTRTFGLVSRKSDSFVSGGPFGPVFVPRGGAAVRFAPRATDPIGTYAVLVVDPRAGSRARAVLVLEQ